MLPRWKFESIKCYVMIITSESFILLYSHDNFGVLYVAAHKNLIALDSRNCYDLYSDSTKTRHFSTTKLILIKISSLNWERQREWEGRGWNVDSGMACVNHLMNLYVPSVWFTEPTFTQKANPRKWKWKSTLCVCVFMLKSMHHLEGRRRHRRCRWEQFQISRFVDDFGIFKFSISLFETRWELNERKEAVKHFNCHCGTRTNIAGQMTWLNGSCAGWQMSLSSCYDDWAVFSGWSWDGKQGWIFRSSRQTIVKCRQLCVIFLWQKLPENHNQLRFFMFTFTPTSLRFIWCWRLENFIEPNSEWLCKKIQVSHTWPTNLVRI